MVISNHEPSPSLGIQRLSKKAYPEISGMFLVTQKISAKEKYYHDSFLRNKQDTHFHFCNRSADKSDIKKKKINQGTLMNAYELSDTTDSLKKTLYQLICIIHLSTSLPFYPAIKKINLVLASKMEKNQNQYLSTPNEEKVVIQMSFSCII